ncbi:MAG: type I glutamate--ammonia ligase [Candidatus Bipolaricaulota bacterium]
MKQNFDEEYSRLSQAIAEEGMEFVDFKVIDLFGRWRHLTVPARNFTKDFLQRGVGFDGSSYGYKMVEDSDMLFVPQLSTARREPAGEGETFSIIGDIFQLTEDREIVPYPEDPRRTAKRAVEFMKNEEIADTFFVSPEFEFYVFSEARFHYGREEGGFKIGSPEILRKRAPRKEEGTPKGNHVLIGHQGYHGPRPGDSVMDIRNKVTSFLEREGVEVKYHHHEIGGAGRSEIEVDPVDLITAADNTMYIKHLIKLIADRNERTATFMPKPIANFPGSGMHLHQYLVKDGVNLFSGKEYAGLSNTALHFIGGLLEHGESLMALTNPSTNSYRRMVPGHEAPTDLIFAKSNRSAAIRIPGYIQSTSRVRIELRTMDGTCNPYLGYAAILMAGLDGIRNQIDPRKPGYGPIDENVYDLAKEEKADIRSVPTSLEGALNALENDHQYLLEGGVFTKDLLAGWINLKRGELQEFYDKPHPYEHVVYYDV